MNLINHIKFFYIFITFFICINLESLAQWVNDPASNTVIVNQVSDPVNINTVKDFEGGAFVFWQDTKEGRKNIYFIHFDENGSPSFRSDGKRVTTSSREGVDPIAVSDNSGNAVVVWSEINAKKKQNLFIQKLTKKGLKLWGSEGLRLTDDKSEKTDFSLKVDNQGYSFVSYIVKNYIPDNKSLVNLVKVDPNGRVVNESDFGSIFNTNNITSESEVIPDNKGGTFIFWLESIKQKNLLSVQHMDSTGVKRWGEKPVIISNPKSSVMNYSVGRMGSNVYAAITYQGTKKLVYQQLVSDSGKLLWGNEGKPISSGKGNKLNPQFIFVDSTVIVSWTSDFQRVKDVYLQRFNLDGKTLWKNEGVKVINNVQNQFGQKLVYDDKNGVIIAWIDKKKNKSLADLSIQKIDLDGNFVWNPNGIKISSSKNLQKSYLNLVSDDNGGAIAVFKGKEGSISNIYGQKIFNTGTYASQILGFSTQVIGDSVKIYWYAANETEGTVYKIQRTKLNSENENDWQTVGTLDVKSKTSANYYEYYDLPDVNGSVFYRIVQMKDGKETQISARNQIDFYKDVTTTVLGQNSPNPFSDSTTITFYLPKDEPVTIEIFNNYIEMIEKIENKDYPAGKNSYTFFANGRKPGIYFYRLKTADFVDVKKMIITN